MLEWGVIFISLIVGLLARIIFFYRLRPWTFRLEQANSGASVVRYRRIRSSYVGFLLTGLIWFIGAGICGNRAPTAITWPGIAFVGFFFFLLSSFALSNGYLCQTIVIIAPDHIQVDQRRRFGMAKQHRLAYNIIRVHYRKVVTRLGVECTLLIDTKQQLNQPLVSNLYDENIIVALKDQIIMQQNLQWSSTLGIAGVLVSGWWM